jgi:penicillin-binding protein 2
MSRQVPLFGYAGEQHPQKGRTTIRRDKGGHERWADAILPADAEAGIIETPTSRRPLLIVAGLVLIAAGILTLQLVKLQLIDGQRNLGLADGNRLRQSITRAPRGVIYDRNNVPLVQNLASFDVTVTPSLLPRDTAKRQQLYAQVGGLIQLTPEEVAKRAETDCIAAAQAAKATPTKAEFECLSGSQARLISANLPREVALNFDQAINTTPGFKLEPNAIRQYKDDGLLAAILGYTGRVSRDDLTANPIYTPTDYIGKLGIERQYEELLRGQNGSEQTEVDAGGRPIKVLSAKPALAGQSLHLTIDMELQRELAKNIQEQMTASGSQRASGIAMNPATGEVLAAVNLPTYDNNLFAGGISQKDYAKLINDPAQPLFNKVMAGAFPVGSIIKPLIGSAVLQEHTITPNTSIEDRGSIEITNKYDSNVKYTYRSYDPGGHGWVNITKAIVVSSDVFFYVVGGGYGNIGGLGVTKLTDYYHKFGLGQKPNLDLPEQTAGRVPTPEWKKKMNGESWTVGDTYNISIGQGDLLASPLQMAVAESVIANGGKVVRPRLLKQVQDASGKTTQTTATKIEREGFISPEYLNLVRGAMRQVVNTPGGTACCRIEQEVPVAVAAKTGTAETDPTGNRKPHAWFTAFAPYDNPQIEMVVLIENSGEGAQYAAPAVRNTLKWCFTRPGGCVR